MQPRRPNARTGRIARSHRKTDHWGRKPSIHHRKRQAANISSTHSINLPKIRIPNLLPFAPIRSDAIISDIAMRVCGLDDAIHFALART
ncbi:hypothetical protein D0U02_00195 [Burkholderia pseudomallei]|uniref:Uncharacterized protein n=2 Tax=Burkholderia pseudomallei TaxID=28450 RepID=A0AAX0UFV8_BURPE|nr:hypothetical protein BURPS668_0625 [Burkholderia pseudomallei 668]ABN89351.1 hypothetical protein BURPS1106A_0640 [Burkholderia pseudomallei 1106a]AFR14516.1 hypothetical protein BPC006_I0628 [Burkholderia pseudomallei BPC006]ARK51469.1 hypothetical protein BOC35_19775 [Burkholderia pseudomallei]EBA48813.1 hypothetical protein BURPS305_4688 [Burkholderia pseudomallei 305]EES23964.1 hypothetical protein BURPS1106B_A3925 [Burkholderia pseudomallei 1106b]PNX05091.1 hypothetical protein CF649_